MTDMADASRTITRVARWQIDGAGYIYTETGVKAARVDASGTIWLWDKYAKVEQPLGAATLYLLTHIMQGVDT